MTYYGVCFHGYRMDWMSQLFMLVILPYYNNKILK